MSAIVPLLTSSAFATTVLAFIPTLNQRLECGASRRIAKQIDHLVTRLEQSDRNHLRLAQKLNQLQPGHPIAIDALWQCLIASENKSQRKQAGNSLQIAATDEQIPQLISKLRPKYEQAVIHQEQLTYFKLLWTWADTLGYSAFLAAWQNTGNEHFPSSADVCT